MRTKVRTIIRKYVRFSKSDNSNPSPLAIQLKATPIFQVPLVTPFGTTKNSNN